MLPIFICRGSARPQAPSISLSPRDERWNDFSRNYHVDINIHLSDESQPMTCRALIMPIDWNNLESEKRFDSWALQQIPPGKSYVELVETLTSDGKPRFVTLLDGESSYRKLALKIDQQQRVELLSKINDLILISEEKKLAVKDRRAILETENFRLGFMRRGSAYQALHRGHRHIWGAGKELLKDARAPFNFECMLRGFTSSSHTLTVDYIDTILLEDRVHCLVGKNGCGKTRLLREIVLMFANKAESGVPCLINNFESTAEKPPEYLGPDFRRVLCFAFDSQANFPTGTRSDARFEYIYTNLTDRDDLSAYESSTSNKNLTRLLVDILRNDDFLGEGVGAQQRYTVLKKALRPYVNFSTILIPLLDEAAVPFSSKDHSGKKWISVSDLWGLNEKTALIAFSYIDLDRDIEFSRGNHERHELSSGHRVFFKFAVSFLSYIDLGTLVILDEPETHLHPNLVCDFMNLVYEVLTATKSIAVVATHSAYVVREVPTHCAHVYLVDDEGRATENQVYLRTLGANIENISQAVFGDSNATKFHQKIADEMVKKNRDFDSIVENFSALMSPDLLSQVSRLIENKNKQNNEDS